MKKLLALVLTGVLASMMLAGCSGGTTKTDDGLVVNKSFSNDSMQTVTGQTVKVAETTFMFGPIDHGYAVCLPEAWKDIPEEQFYLSEGDGVCTIGFMPQAANEALAAVTGDESADGDARQAAYTAAREAVVPVAMIYAAKDDKVDDATQALAKEYERSEVITTANGYTYYLASNTKAEGVDLAAADQETLATLTGGVASLKDNLLLFPAVEDESTANLGDLSQFTAEDMAGQSVDQTIFANYDLTMVNIWSTWCSVCIEEMGDLQTLYEQLPSNVNMITICADAADEKELAQEILDENKATFQTLVGNDVLQEALLKNVSGFPTTIFVDKDGHIVGDPQMGAPGSDVVSGYQNLINQNLKKAVQ